MNFILGLIVGLIIGGAGVYFLMKGNRAPGKEAQTEPENFNPAVEEKRQNMEDLEKYIAQKTADEKITNDEVQNLLKVSDATATRYLNDLEKEGTAPLV